MSLKTTRVLLTAFLINFSCNAHATQNAKATCFCWSLRFHEGVNSFGDSTLDLYTLPGAPNGELAPWFQIYTHKSLFVLDWMGVPISGTNYLDLLLPDANTNGFFDDFEVAQAVAGTTFGEYATAMGGGRITATWSRAAGSKDGTCLLHLVDDTFGDLGVYRHTFEVLELTGPLTYTPGSNTVRGSVNLTNANDQWQGPVSFMKLAPTNYNQLTLAAGGWTNAAMQTLTYSSANIARDPRWPTNYYGGLAFADGDPNTGGADYRFRVLSIDDLNDSDHDGIPDFSDTPAPAARRPWLALARGTTNLLLTISGDVNRLHHILESTNLVSGNWETNLSLTLTNDPQTVSLPLPPGGMKFWRARVE